MLRNSNAVLIETYWNVNDDALTSLDQRLLVLIETYWNVNCSMLNFP